MDILNQLETQPIPLEEDEKRHTRRLLVGVVCALVITGLVFGGYLFLRKRHERQVAATEVLEVKKNSPKVEVLVDDAVVKGKTTTLSGTVHNISPETLQNIAVELALRRRAGSGIETRIVVTDAPVLPPDGRARYSLEVATQDYSTSTFMRVLGGSDRTPVAFKAMPGNAAPPMESPASKTVVVDKPNLGKRDEFINTPNNPGRIP
jgi:hypothetical protein